MRLKFNDKEYWSKYYKKLIEKKANLTPSPFAEHIVNNGIIQKNNSLIELGCGNGRDAIFFAKKQIFVTAIDQCANTTKILNNYKNINAYPADFTNMNNLSEKTDVIYSRFTMHSVDEKGEDSTLKWVFENLLSGGVFCIEARTIKDPLCGRGEDKGNNIWFYNNHHRRFIDANYFKNKLIKNGFAIEFYKESNGFAKYKDEDPIVLRAIVRKV